MTTTTMTSLARFSSKITRISIFRLDKVGRWDDVTYTMSFASGGVEYTLSVDNSTRLSRRTLHVALTVLLYGSNALK